MPVNWMDTSPLSFNHILLLEHAHLTWLPASGIPSLELALALRANPAVEWTIRHKAPELNAWLDGIVSQAPAAPALPERARQAEQVVLAALTDWLVYVMDPAIYDQQPFLQWDSRELSSLVDFNGKTVLDIGAGTGRLALVAAENGARVIFAVEPVGRLRTYLRQKALDRGFKDIYAVDGLITAIPFPDAFADVVMGGHVFGEYLEAELTELQRVTRPGGMIILCPGNNDQDNDVHRFLVERGFSWGRFEEPVDGVKRKYWRSK
ncbi:MAG TPA: class I SAM-dependent methyltransferase [Anaerolineaceae bacterium]|nr:class I SAM-dependent methyltransferase [Anaerolineaceae bacterium]HPN54269.1 class I SAM-dependent methyltransferase [Anaerolineaceae bacterium]